MCAIETLEESLNHVTFITSRISSLGNRIGPVCVSVFLCVCLSVSAQSITAKGLYIGGTREVRECSGVFITL